MLANMSNIENLQRGKGHINESHIRIALAVCSNELLLHH